MTDHIHSWIVINWRAGNAGGKLFNLEAFTFMCQICGEKSGSDLEIWKAYRAKKREEEEKK